MRIGFLDCKTNTQDAYPVFRQLCDRQVGIDIDRLSAPNPFKVPAACKKLFDRQVDAVIAVVTTESDNDHELAFLRDKVADVEIAAGKYVFLVIQDVNVLAEQLAADLDRALHEALEHLPAQPPATSGGMDMFGNPGAPSGGSGSSASSASHDDEDVQDFLHDSHKLF